MVPHTTTRTPLPRLIIGLMWRHLLPGALLIYVGLGALLFFAQRSFIYHPSNEPLSNCTLPANTEIVRFGNTPTEAVRGKADSDTLVVLYHGNAGGVCDRTWYATSFFQPQNVAYLLVSYHGYADPTVSPRAETIRHNVSDVVAWIETQSYDRVLLVSESLGGGAAAYHASLAAPAGLFLSTPFTSIADAARDIYPLYPVSWLLRESLPVADHLSTLPAETTVWLVHGTNDRIVAAAHSQTLAQSLAHTNPALILIPDAGHNDVYQYPEWQAALTAFLSLTED